MRIHGLGKWHRLLACGVAIATVTLAGGVVPAVAGSPQRPRLRLIATAASVTVDNWLGFGASLDLGAAVVADRAPLQVWVKRHSYARPVTAHQMVGGAGRQRRVPLPAGLVTGFTGMPAFTHLTVTDPSGAAVVDRDESFCPNATAVRHSPDAPESSPYPRGCSSNPFALGAVWGIQTGWRARTTLETLSTPVDLPDGAYTAVVSINAPYRDLFGVRDQDASVTVAVTVRTVDPFPPTGPATAASHTAAHQHTVNAAGLTLPAAASRPTATASTPRVPRGPKPDLRALPAWRIGVRHNSAGDHLSFNATVWTAGNSPLVVDGFRLPGTDLMDAYQYFYDSAGNQVGAIPTGTFEWDAREGHHHWHFTDFARYRLLDASGQVAVRSQKEAFCLANTGAVDYTIPGAVWQPVNTDLSQWCGVKDAQTIRQRLDIGSGDTYLQFLPGQSFTVTDLPNGVYHIEITANPEHRLHELTTANNTSLRKIVLGGVPGARTVEVPPHQGIDG